LGKRDLLEEEEKSLFATVDTPSLSESESHSLPMCSSP
jgi:hypothetical protein